MNKEVEKMIRELKDIVLKLHRSAADLDSVIQGIEMEIGINPNKEFLNMFVARERGFRKDIRECHYSSLEQKEDIIWSRLIKVMKEES